MIANRAKMRKGRITDSTILANCALQIKDYIQRLNNIDVRAWTVNDIKTFLTENNTGLSFTDFADNYIKQMISDNRDNSAQNYKAAINSLKRFTRKENLLFSDITANTLREWIRSIAHTKRAKNMYPVLIRRIFDEGRRKLNDYDRNIIRITNHPFETVRIPYAEVPKKRTSDKATIRMILDVKPETSREKLAHDIILLILYLAGINLVDLYSISHKALSNGKLCYNRTKEKKTRKDGAYFEITVPDTIIPIMQKYAGVINLLSFKETYATHKGFNKAVNTGIKSLCDKAKVNHITVYWLRHTWATIAQNECGASIEQVAFCLNHASAHRVTESYVKKDFSIVDIINEQVIKRIFD
jgi:site-specific recombinase XerD